MPPQAARKPVRVWDLPVRLFHWLLLLLLMAMWLTGEQREIETHTRIGVAVLGLVVFRILWGFLGSETARFRHFVKSPAAVLGYLGGRVPHRIGHNPLGGWSVALILLTLLAQCTLGLFAHDVDGMESGPLSYLVSYDTADLARIWHNRLFNLVLALAAIHITAVFTYLFVKGDNILLPMVTGERDLPEPVHQPAAGSPLWLAVSIGAAVFLAWWIGAGAPLPGPFAV